MLIFQTAKLIQTWRGRWNQKSLGVSLSYKRETVPSKHSQNLCSL